MLWNGAKREEPNFHKKLAGLINHIPNTCRSLINSLKLTSTSQVGCKCMCSVRDDIELAVSTASSPELAVVQENIKLLLGAHE